MNKIKYPTKILNMLIILFNLLLFTKVGTFNNPHLISTNSNPIIFQESKKYGCYYVLTSGKYYILDSMGELLVNDTFEEYSSPYTWINVGNNTKYIFAKDKYINVTLSEKNISYQLLDKPEGLVYPDNYFGSMIETSCDSNNGLCPTEENEIIIYGKQGEHALVFTFLKQKISCSMEFSNPKDKIECKIIQKGRYFCAISNNNYVQIRTFTHRILSSGCILESDLSRTKAAIFDSHTYPQLFDYDINNKTYLLCAQNLSTKYINCLWFQMTEKITLYDNIALNFPTSSDINHDLIIFDFAGEKLYCYGETDFIKCYRVNETNNIVNTFKLESPGSNSKLSFFTDGNTYVNLFFLNYYSGSTNIYMYTICLPYCQNLVYSIIIYHSIGEEKKYDLNELFPRMTNTKYYIEFETQTLPNEYGNLMVNDTIIFPETNNKILLEKGKKYLLDFVSTEDQNNTVDNFKINYKILINETYSKQCTIDLTISPCYDSCSHCSKAKSSSSSDDHNCLEDKCKEGYYPSPLKVTNCIKSEEKQTNWYLDTETNRFGLCHSNCATCSQNYNALTSNCDTCANSELNLLDGNCISTCPEGYYSTVSNGINVCKKCYKNCLKCTQVEIYSNSVLTDMNCLKCKKGEDPNDSNNLIENQIKIYNNCFPIIIYTNEKITFNTSDMSSGEIEKSCLDYGKAIMPGEYECIEKPTNYFYVVQDDNNTGIIELCDEACSTCTWGKNNLTNNTNCINCTEGYFKTQDSNTNCILESLIPENYFKNNSDNIYYKCHSNCQKCDEYYDIAKDDMHCTQCPSDFYFLYGTNNCYNMSFVDENSYYLSKEDNKYHQCYLNCLRCSQPGSDENNQNCDKCISGFYFENDTQNCYNDSILENGYYFDNFTISPGEDATYKKCYENCKTCNNTITNNSNMNCISCKDNFYKINGTNNCYNETLKTQGYYLKENIFYPCEDNCKTCSDSKTEINGTISNNCLSCDYSTKNLYLVSTLKNCEPEEFKENGYYLAQEPNNPNIKYFYKCYFSCALCDKGEESSNHNCLTCRENFYPKKDDINPKNCYNETEMSSQGYILVNSTSRPSIQNLDNISIDLIGLCDFQNSDTGASFYMYFYSNSDLTGYDLSFPVTTQSDRLLRSMGIYDARCEITDKINENMYEYYCKIDSKIEGVVKIADISQFKFFSLTSEIKNFNLVTSPLAESYMDNLQNIPEDLNEIKNSNFYVLDHTKIEINNIPYFNFSGIIEQNPKFKNNNFKLTVISKSGNETKKSEINCTLINIANNNYIFNCKGKKGEKYNLEGALSSNEDNILILKFDNSSNISLINFEASGNNNNRINFSKKNGNLSTGAIVAIVLSLAIALGSFIIFLIYLRTGKKGKHTETTSSTINLKIN